MITKHIRIVLFVLVALSFSRTDVPLSVQAANAQEPMIRSTAEAELNAMPINIQSLIPLPNGCLGNLPPGNPKPVCCISGYVFLNGHPVDGATVQITTGEGQSTSAKTQIQRPGDTLAFYSLNLSSQPLNVRPGDMITITATYLAFEKTMTHRVRKNGQQVDIVFPSSQEQDLAYYGELIGQPRPGGLYRPQNFAINRQGEIHIVDSSAAQVQIYNTNGEYLRLFDTANANEGRTVAYELDKPYGIAIDQQDNVYIADTGNHRIVKFTSAGRYVTEWGNEGDLPDGININNWFGAQLDAPMDIVFDDANNLYVSDSANHRIVKFSNTGMLLGTWGAAGSGIDQLTRPVGLTYQDDILYIVDQGNRRIQRLKSDGQFMDPWPLTVEGQSKIKFVDMALDQNGNAYATKQGANTVIKLDRNGTQLDHEWAFFSNGSPRFSGPAGIGIHDDGSIFIVNRLGAHMLKFDTDGGQFPGGYWGHEGRLNAPSDVATDASGNFYVVDQANHRILKFSSSGESLGSWGGQGTDAGRFNSPSGIVIDHANNIYVSDANGAIHHRIQKFTTDGDFVDSWGGDQGSEDGQFSYPKGLAINSRNRLFVADRDNHRVQVFDLTGNYLTQFGTEGNGEGEFKLPRDIAIDSQDFIYVTDKDNDRIQVFDADGNYVRMWGRKGSEPGQFDHPYGITIDANDNVYVMDEDNHRLQKFTKVGDFLGEWGKPGISAARFFEPAGITIDHQNTLYIADRSNDRVQLWRPLTYRRPIATIVWRSEEATSLGADDSLELIGLGQDSDATNEIVEYRWSSNKDGSLGNSAMITISASSLTSGTHRISLIVVDDEGELSDPVSTHQIYVNPPIDKPQLPKWTMLLYLVGDDDDGFNLMNELERAIARLKHMRRAHLDVQVAIQIDGPRSINSNAPDTRRLLLPVGSHNFSVEGLSIGEQAMDDPATLTDFVRWGQQELPAQNYYLVIADHGQAINGIGWDATSDLADDGISNQSAYLTVKEIAQALSETDIAPIDLLHLDGCSINLLDVAYELRHSTDYLIASQYLAWSFFAYDRYRLHANEAESPADFASMIVDEYIEQARTGSKQPATLSALNLSRAEPIRIALDGLAVALATWQDGRDEKRQILERIRSETQMLDSNGDFDNNDLDLYIDLVDWLTKLSKSPEIEDEDILTQIDRLKHELKFLDIEGYKLIVNNQTQSVQNFNPPNTARIVNVRLENANGISIYYPHQVLSEVYAANQVYELTLTTEWAKFLNAITDRTERQEPQPIPLVIPPRQTQELYLPLVVR
ncbi:6-bladed beta-propeller [Chloroflexi bacterium TSY]|nr:6-bladed beta-propeller [Chloroflexi bacterium TSY]